MLASSSRRIWSITVRKPWQWTSTREVMMAEAEATGPAPALRQWSLVRVLRTVPSDRFLLTGKVSSWGPRIQIDEPMDDLISYSNHSNQFLKIQNPMTCSKFRNFSIVLV